MWNLHLTYAQIISAERVEQQCKIAQDIIKDAPLDNGLEAVAHQVEFLMQYHDEYSNALVGSRLDGIVRRDYQQTLTNAVAFFRSKTTNDLGGNPQAWIQNYGH
jgi:hypothetical protein